MNEPNFETTRRYYEIAEHLSKEGIDEKVYYERKLNAYNLCIKACEGIMENIRQGIGFDADSIVDNAPLFFNGLCEAEMYVFWQDEKYKCEESPLVELCRSLAKNYSTKPYPENPFWSDARVVLSTIEYYCMAKYNIYLMTPELEIMEIGVDCSVRDVTKNDKRKVVNKSFRDIIQYKNENLSVKESCDKLINRLHELIDGKGGADVGAVLLNAFFINQYLTRFPTKKEYTSEFVLIGTWNAIYNNYHNTDNPAALEKAQGIKIF